jgi:hypothetical protein
LAFWNLFLNLCFLILKRNHYNLCFFQMCMAEVVSETVARLLLQFSHRLASVRDSIEVVGKTERRMEETTRKEGEKRMFETSHFRAIMFKNAPRCDGVSIITEKGSWT